MMQFKDTKGLQALLAAAVTAMVVMPIAIAGASGPGATGSAKKGAANQTKALKKQVSALAKQVAALAGQNAALEGKVAALEAQKTPASLPPNGSAGGVLTGTYPKPGLGSNTVGSLNIVDGSVLAADIGSGAVQSANILDGTIQSADILDGTIGASDLGGVERVVGDAVGFAEPDGPKTATVTCPAGKRLLSGGYTLDDGFKDNDSVITSAPSATDPSRTWEAVARANTNGEANTLHAVALCINP